MPQVDPADLRRRFWALFLDSTVQSDGQVPGFAHWWDSSDEWQRAQAMRYAFAAAEKIDRDGRDPDECIVAGVRSLRDALRNYIRPHGSTPCTPDEVRQLVAILTRELGWRDPPRSPAPPPPSEATRPTPRDPNTPDELWWGALKPEQRARILGHDVASTEASHASQGQQEPGR